MTADKRIHHRFPLHRGVEIKLPSGVIVCGVTRDLSFGGSFIECDTTELQSGGECYLSVVLENDVVSTEIFTDICYHNEDGVGCRFLTFASDYYQFLSNYSLLTSVS